MYVLKKGGAKAKQVAPSSQKKQAKKKPQKKQQAKGENKPKVKKEPPPPPEKKEEAKVEPIAEPKEQKQEAPKPEEKKPVVVDDGTLAKPEAQKPEDKPKEPPKPPPSSCTNVILRGDAKNVPDAAHHRFIQRTSKNGRLQVVAEPREVLNISFGSEAAEDWESNKEVFEALRGHFKPKQGRTWDQLLAAGRDLKKRQEEADKAKAGHHGWELYYGMTYKGAFLAKKVSFEIIADFTPKEQEDAKSCVVKNASGKAYKAEPFEEAELAELLKHNPAPQGKLRKAWKAEVEHVANGWAINAKPTVYKVEVKGGDGKVKSGTLEVLPPTVNTLEMELGGKQDKSNAFEKINGWLEKIGGEGVKFEIKVGGGYEFFWGWKEQIEDSGEESQIWRAVYVIEGAAGMKPLIGAKAELTVSALQIAFGMPQCLTKHIADVRLGVSLSGSVSVQGYFESKYWAGKELGAAGGIRGKGNLSFGLELSAFAGSKVIYQIEAKGGVRTGITVDGAFEFSHEGVDLKHSGQWDGVVLECSVTSYYLVWGSHEHAKGEWKAFDPMVLWNKTKPLKRWEDKKVGEKKE